MHARIWQEVHELMRHDQGDFHFLSFPFGVWHIPNINLHKVYILSSRGFAESSGDESASNELVVILSIHIPA